MRLNFKHTLQAGYFIFSFLKPVVTQELKILRINNHFKLPTI